MSTKVNKLPNVLIIGAQKAGTTSLFHWLSQHPDILAPEHAKDFNAFFLNDNLYEKGNESYSQVFDGYAGERVVLAGNVNYMYYPHVADRILKFNKDIKLIVLLREPIERAKSAYLYAKQRGIEGRAWEEVISKADAGHELTRNPEQSQEHYLEHGLYSKQLKNYYACFKKEQIWVGLFEDLIKNPQLTLREIFDFLDVNDCKAIDYEKKNPTAGSARFKAVGKLLYSRNSLLRRFIRPLMKLVPNKLKFWLITSLSSLNAGKEIKGDNLSQFDSLLHDYYRDDVKALKDLLNSKLSAWEKFKS